MPRVNKVMKPHDKQMKLTAVFLERNLVHRSDLTKHTVIGGLRAVPFKSQLIVHVGQH